MNLPLSRMLILTGAYAPHLRANEASKIYSKNSWAMARSGE